MAGRRTVRLLDEQRPRRLAALGGQLDHVAGQVEGAAAERPLRQVGDQLVHPRQVRRPDGEIRP